MKNLTILTLALFVALSTTSCTDSEAGVITSIKSHKSAQQAELDRFYGR